MTRLLNQILSTIPNDVFSDTELFELIKGTEAARYNLVKRSLANGEIIRIRRGLYCLAQRYQRKGVHPFELALRIYGPSYVSFEAALSYHGLIPESVQVITCATSKRQRTFQTPLGTYTYAPVPMRAFMIGVERIVEGRHIFLVATPLKSIIDYLYTNKLDWVSLEPLQQSLRIDVDNVRFDTQELNDLHLSYNSKRVSKFIEGIKKDLNL